MRQETYDTHALWPVVDEVKGLLGGDLKPTNGDERYLVRRVNSVVDFVDGLRDADPMLVEQAPLDALHTNISSIKQALTQYLNDTNAKQYLQASADQVPSVMATARQHFPWSAPDEAQRGTKAAATRYKNALDHEVERLQREVDSLRDELAGAQQQREADRAKLQESLATLDGQIESRGKVLDDLQLRSEQQVEAAKADFVKEAAARKEEFGQAEATRVDAEQERIENLAARAEDQFAEQTRASATLIESLEKYRDQAKALTDETSRHAVAGEYGTWAAHQAKAAYRWTVATVVAGVATVGGLVLALKSAGDDSSQYILSKLSISLVGLFIAAYTAHQASEHRREERTAKRLALDLAALQPFLEQIADDDELEKLRLAVANRVFVPAADAAPTSEVRVRLGRGNSISMGSLTELIRTILGPGGAPK